MRLRVGQPLQPRPGATSLPVSVTGNASAEWGRTRSGFNLRPDSDSDSRALQNHVKCSVYCSSETRTPSRSCQLEVQVDLAVFFLFFLHTSHSISFTRAQGIPKYKIGFGREKDGRVGERLVEGGGGHGARDGGWGEQLYHHRRPGAGMTPSQTLPVTVSASMTDPSPGAGGSLRRCFKLVVLIIVLLHATLVVLVELARGSTGPSMTATDSGQQIVRFKFTRLRLGVGGASSH